MKIFRDKKIYLVLHQREHGAFAKSRPMTQLVDDVGRARMISLVHASSEACSQYNTWDLTASALFMVYKTNFDPTQSVFTL